MKLLDAAFILYDLLQCYQPQFTHTPFTQSGALLLSLCLCLVNSVQQCLCGWLRARGICKAELSTQERESRLQDVQAK